MRNICPACQQEQLHQPATCTVCGYPFDGSAAQQARHVERYKAVWEPSPDAEVLKRPRLILYAMALLSAGYLVYTNLGGGFVWGDLALNFGLIAALAVCARNLHRNPMLFAATPLVLFVLINALHFFVDPALAYGDLWLKLVVACGLLVALRLVVQVLKERGELGVE